MRYHPSTRGFTLIETLTVVAIMGIVSGAIMWAIVYLYKGNAYIFEAEAAVENARRGLATAVGDIREASYADDGAYPIGSAATSSITFYSDIDEDGGIERVKLYLLGDTMYRVVTNAAGNPPSYTGQTSATSTVAVYVRNTQFTPVFVYYDDTGTAFATTSSPSVSSIRSVAITILTDLNPNRAPNVLTLTGSATLRNLRD